MKRFEWANAGPSAQAAAAGSGTVADAMHTRSGVRAPTASCSRPAASTCST